MKIKKIKYLNNKILKLHVLKLLSKKQGIQHKSQFVYTQLCLNKIANIIYRYDINNRKILFLGFPIKFKKSLKNTKHKIIPTFLSFNGILTNKNSFNKVTKVKNYSLSTLKILLQIKKPDLVIIYEQNLKSTAIQESYITRIPTIIFSSNLSLNSKMTYQFPLNYKLLNEKSNNTNFVVSFLTSILERAKKNR